jgi:cytochrome P450
MLAKGKTLKDMMHFGFGYGARVCPGKHLGQLETALTVGALVKMFEFEAVTPENTEKAGVSTKPLDGTDVIIRIRDPFKKVPTRESV